MSQFINHKDIDMEYSSEIDFDDAIKLPSGGSTCDIYKTRWQRRAVFVKRLKEEFRDKPIYLDAIDKEFEIGANLKHPSLPDYLCFGRDYIVMDFIDGLTLDEMIKNHDPWLANERNVVKMLRELIDVVGYLHRHNVVHCDIKPDNIMITSNGHNLVLIDLDKCYTDSLDDTSGHPGKYGLPQDEPGRMTMDFRGIAQIVERMRGEIPGFKFGRYKKFESECYKSDVSASELLELLDKRKTGSSLIAYAIFASFILIAGIIISFFYFSNPPKETTKEHNDVEVEKDSAAYVSDKVVTETSVDKPEIFQQDGHSADSGIEAVTTAELHEIAQKKAAILDDKIKPYYDKLNGRLDFLIELKKDSTVTSKQLLEEISKFDDIENELMAETWEIINETFPGISEREIWRILAYSKVYTSYKRRSAPEIREIGREIDRRRSAN